MFFNFLDILLLCTVCFSRGESKFFEKGGIKHHYRLNHRETFDEKKSVAVFRENHGKETARIITDFMKDRQQEKDFSKFDVNSRELGRMTLSTTSRIEALKLFGLVVRLRFCEVSWPEWV